MNSTQKSLAWLVRQNEMTCGFCDSYIDLPIGDNRACIDELARTCSSLDAALAKSSELTEKADH